MEEEDPIMNSMSKSRTDNYDDDDDDDNNQEEEESGWTMYFDDFLQTNKKNEKMITTTTTTSFFSSSSDLMVSDAASSVAKNEKEKAAAATATANEGGFLPLLRNCKRLSFKKRKTKGALMVDDALEDTASSPVNSPKVSQMYKMEMRPKEQKDNIGIYEKKGNVSSQANERNEVGFVGRESGPNTELKKRGLCLVPMSMLVNYLG